MKLNVKFIDNITPVLQKAQQEINNLPQEALKVFVENTPIDKGRARRATKLRSKKQILADYPYAQRLNEGYSKQSPEGMLKPTEDFLIKEYQKIMTGK